MKKTIYLYLLDTMADWEVGYILQALSMQQMLPNHMPHYTLKTVAPTLSPIKSLGGLTITPDYSLSDLDDDEAAALLLPGANTWNDALHQPILEKAITYIKKGTLVGAICGATLALADLGILNNYLHTSNSLAYLDGFSPNYKGHTLFQNDLSVRDHHVITASSAGGLLWAKQILEYLGIYSPKTIESWYQYYLTGNPEYFMDLLSSFNS
ncbi:MAG: DJ-1/PfpI family protein [Cellulosilyticaceae bacterium]